MTNFLFSVWPLLARRLPIYFVLLFTAGVQGATLGIQTQAEARVVPGGLWSMKCGASNLKQNEVLQIIKVRKVYIQYKDISNTTISLFDGQDYSLFCNYLGNLRYDLIDLFSSYGIIC